MEHHEPSSVVFVHDNRATETRVPQQQNFEPPHHAPALSAAAKAARPPEFVAVSSSELYNFRKSGALLDRWPRWLAREEGQPAPPLHVAAPAPQSGRKEEGVGFATQRQTTPLQGLPVLSALCIVYLYYTVLYVINYMTRVHYTGLYFLKYNIQFD